MNLKLTICECDKLLLPSWPWSLYPPYGNIQTKANEASYQVEGPAGFCFYGIHIFKGPSLSPRASPSPLLTQQHPLVASITFLPATKTKYLWHSQRGIKSLHFQDVDFIGYSILQAPEYTMDIKSTFVSPRNRTREMEGKLCIILNLAFWPDLWLVYQVGPCE